MANNEIGAEGISIQTYEEIVEDIVDGTATVKGLKQIYGSNINVDSNSPDGQMVNIFALSKQDVLDLIVQCYNSRDPDQAVGVSLDSVSQLCGITRRGGTYTEVYITVTVDSGLNLSGLDTSDPFTVADGNGNQFNLITSASLTAGANSLLFRAEDIGEIQVLANTITTIVTVIAGVTSVNNPSTPSQEGTDEETDSELRIRRQKSVAIPAKGILDGMVGAILALDDVTDVAVYENYGTTTDVYGVPPHSIWVVVEGGTNADISETIYKYKSLGCGMKGDVSVPVTQEDGNSIDIAFDRVTYEELSIFMKVESITGGAIDTDDLKSSLVSGYDLDVYEKADSTSVIALVKGINPDLVVTECSVSKDKVTYDDTVTPTLKRDKFTLAVADITVITSTESSSSCSSSQSSSSSSVSSSCSSSSCRSSSSSSSSRSSSSSSSSCSSSSSSVSSSSSRSSSCSSSSSSN